MPPDPSDRLLPCALPGRQPLLVYGTLLPGLRLAGEMAGAEWIGPGTVPGTLFDLGSYPGVKLLPAGLSGPEIGQVHGLVHGLVYGVDAAHLARLDAVEERVPGDDAASLYLRLALPCQPADPATASPHWPAQVWVYVYNRAVDGCPRIPSGDYRAYLERG